MAWAALAALGFYRRGAALAEPTDDVTSVIFSAIGVHATQEVCNQGTPLIYSTKKFTRRSKRSFLFSGYLDSKSVAF